MGTELSRIRDPRISSEEQSYYDGLVKLTKNHYALRPGDEPAMKKLIRRSLAPALAGARSVEAVSILKLKLSRDFDKEGPEYTPQYLVGQAKRINDTLVSTLHCRSRVEERGSKTFLVLEPDPRLIQSLIS